MPIGRHLSVSEKEENLSFSKMGCACCFRRAIIYRMKEDLLDNTKTIPTPPGVGSKIWEKYVGQIRSSDGFDLDQKNIPKESFRFFFCYKVSPYATLSILPIKRDNGLCILPIKRDNGEYNNLCYLANKSLEWMKAKNDKSYKLVKVKKANVMEGGMGIRYTYFISFTAKEPEKPVMEFQAKVESRSEVSDEGFGQDLDKTGVEFCRVKTKI